MKYIRDRDGNVISKSHNLRGIRDYVGKYIIKKMAIGEIGRGEGKLLILFENGASFECNFASYTVLVDFVRRWRNVYGAPIQVGNIDAGIVARNNPFLQ